jgi:drug/metabolite transporter (DMT)-like permease
VSGHLLIKAGLNSLTPVPAGSRFGVRLMHAVLQPQVLAGLSIYLIGTLCWMRAVSQKDISFLYPLSSVNYVLVAIASIVLFGEIISAQRATGVVLVVLGMILINRRSGEERQ